MDKELQEIAKKLLSEKKVDWIIGYERGYDILNRPVFINKIEDVGKLVINKYCVNNLAVYLPKRRKFKIGIVAKGCDVKSIRELIKEHQISKENVTIISVVCEGVVEKKNISKLAEKCDYCDEKVPKNLEILIGTVKEFAVKPDDGKDIKDFEKLSPKEKEKFWNEQFEKCIRCYACRQVCSVCYCPDCFEQRARPEYINKKVTDAENKLFQLIRMHHVFGRCTDCRACDNACPVGIPLRLITKKITKDAYELFGYVSGADETTRPPLSTFKHDEKLEEIM
ncbi:MAG: 4Fe-4S dicluster domain-containing protein [Candidatus Firestonebacteria bacterium]